jgi:DNA-binding transcriptional ArsR family regulator
MREQEVCVGYFTEVLGDSQPKISRHLAYLRNVGIVEARREGKWMHYRIKWPEDRAIAAVIDATLRSLSGQSECRSDMEMYVESFGSNDQVYDRSERQLDTYVQAHVTEDEDEFETSRSSHNELEEFLL